MWHAADLNDKLHNSVDYAYNPSSSSFNWSTFKPKRDAYINKLRGIYQTNWSKEGIDLHRGFAKFVDTNTLSITRPDGSTYEISGDQICISTGGVPTKPSDNDIPGASLGIDSDGFFDLETQPKRVAVVG